MSLCVFRSGAWLPFDDNSMHRFGVPIPYSIEPQGEISQQITHLNTSLPLHSGSSEILFPNALHAYVSVLTRHPPPPPNKEQTN